VNWSLAAGLLLVVLGGALSVVKIVRLQDELKLARFQPMAPQGQTEEFQRHLAEQRLRNTQLAEGLHRQQEQRNTLGQELASLKRPFLASFVLMPGRSRGGGQADKLVIPPSAVLVQLQLDLATASQPSYRAFLNNGQGSEIWSQAELKAKVTADGQVV